jgi:hypothetical protein
VIFECCERVKYTDLRGYFIDNSQGETVLSYYDLELLIILLRQILQRKVQYRVATKNSSGSIKFHY